MVSGITLLSKHTFDAGNLLSRRLGLSLGSMGSKDAVSFGLGANNSTLLGRSLAGFGGSAAVGIVQLSLLKSLSLIPC